MEGLSKYEGSASRGRGLVKMILGINISLFCRALTLFTKCVRVNKAIT